MPNETSREIEARKGQQHQPLRGGLKGRGPQEKILWQQITDRLARTIEEVTRNSRRDRRLLHPGKARQGEKIFIYLEKEIELDDAKYLEICLSSCVSV